MRTLGWLAIAIIGLSLTGIVGGMIASGIMLVVLTPLYAVLGSVGMALVIGALLALGIVWGFKHPTPPDSPL